MGGFFLLLPFGEPATAGLGGRSVAAGVSLLVALPLILFFIREPQWRLARVGHITVGPGSLWTLRCYALTWARLSLPTDLLGRDGSPAAPPGR